MPKLLSGKQRYTQGQLQRQFHLNTLRRVGQRLDQLDAPAEVGDGLVVGEQVACLDISGYIVETGAGE